MLKIFKLFCFISLIIFSSFSSAQDNVFEGEDQLGDQVNFWVRIYSEVTTDQGLIHDYENLAIVYEAIDTRNGSGKNRRAYIQDVKDKYKAILLNLSKNFEFQDNLNSEDKRVLQLFPQPVTEKTFLDAIENMRFQLGQKDKFIKGISVFKKLEPMLRQIFNKHGVPEDLVYLPQVESSFNVNAYSKFGAAGLWQFTRGTGRIFLKIGYSIDERLDPFKSTDAAARLLKKNFEFIKKWPLAITAYNHGLNGMNHAVKVTKSTDIVEIIKNYKGRAFGFASRNFYCEFLAARKIMKNIDKYFPTYESIKIPELKPLVISKFIDIKYISKYLNLSIEELARFNPSLRFPVLKSQQFVPLGFELLVPAENFDQYLENFKKIPAKYFTTKQKVSNFYVVKRGDTLVKIAKKFGTTAKALKKLNGLKSKRVLRGQRLKVPVKEEVCIPEDEIARIQMVSAKKSDNSKALKDAIKRLKVAEKKVALNTQSDLIKSKVSVDEPAKQPTMAATQSMTVAPIKETLIKTSPSDHTTDKTASEEEISASDKPSKLEPEDSAQVDEKIDTAEPLKACSKNVKDGKNKYQTVGDDSSIFVDAEETIGHYADWLNVSVKKLRKLNKLSFKRQIRLNQKIYLDFSRVSVEKFNQQRDEFHKSIEEDFWNNYKVVNTAKHKVRSSESLWFICNKKYEVPLWLLIEYNDNVDFSNLKVGTVLQIPLVEPNSKENNNATTD